MDGCIKWGSKRKGQFLGVNVWHPIVTIVNLMHSCADLREPIELLLRVVSGVGRGMAVIGEGKVLGGFSFQLV